MPFSFEGHKLFHLLRQGRYKDILDQLIGFDLSTNDQILLVEVYFDLGDEKKAEKLLNSSDLTHLAPNGVLEYLQGRLHRLKGQLPKAVQFFSLVASKKGSYLCDKTKNELTTVYYRWGKLDVAFDLIQEVVQSSPWVDLVCAAYNYYGQLYLTRGQQENATEAYKTALSIAQEVSNRYHQANALRGLSVLKRRLNKLEEAYSLNKQAIKICDEEGYEYLLAGILNNQAIVLENQGYLSKSLELYRKSLRIQESLNSDIFTHSIYQNNIGFILHQMGFLREAQDFYEESLANRRKVGNPEPLGITLNNLANLLHDRGEWETSYIVHKEAIEQFERSLSREGLALELVDFARLLITYPKEDVSEVVRRFPSSEDTTNLPLKGFYSMLKGLIHLHEGDLGSATCAFEFAKQIVSMGIDYQLLCHRYLTEVALKKWNTTRILENFDNIINRLAEWETKVQQHHLIVSMCHVLVLRAKLALSLLQVEEAESYFQRALSLTDNYHLPLHKALVQEEIYNLTDLQKSLGSMNRSENSINDPEILHEFTSYLQSLTEHLSRLEGRQK